MSELACLEHPRLVNCAYFSPQTGSKLMTTCIDNRIRVWDYLHSIGRDADREIVHSHDFNRYLTPFRAEWDHKDPHERMLVVGRYGLFRPAPHHVMPVGVHLYVHLYVCASAVGMNTILSTWCVYQNSCMFGFGWTGPSLSPQADVLS